jgi:hypothetical protein
VPDTPYFTTYANYKIALAGAGLQMQGGYSANAGTRHSQTVPSRRTSPSIAYPPFGVPQRGAHD